MPTVHLLNVVSVVLIIGGAVAAVFGLAAQSRGRYPQLFTYGVVLLVLGVALLVITVLVGAAV